MVPSPQPPAPESDPEAEWEEIKILLIEEGNLADPLGAIEAARANGCQPGHVRELVDEYAWKFPGRWTPGELWHRVRMHGPKIDPAKGWGPGDLRAVERYKSLARELQQAIEAMTDERFAEISEKYLGCRHGRDSPDVAGATRQIIDRRIKDIHREAAKVAK